MLHCPASEAVEPIVVVLRIHSTAVEVQVPAVRLRVERTRPVVAVRATVVPRLAIAVAGAGAFSPTLKLSREQLTEPLRPQKAIRSCLKSSQSLKRLRPVLKRENPQEA